MLTKTDTSRGFTLIELLVVIAIIGLLSSVIMVSLQSARAKAYDARRLSDMQQIRTALEMFYNDHNRYPGPVDGVDMKGEQIGVGDDIDRALQPYLPKIPKDPQHDGTNFYYAYDPGHCVSPPPNCSSCPRGGVVFGFYQASDPNFEKDQDTCSGGDQGLDRADFNRALFPASTQ